MDVTLGEHQSDKENTMSSSAETGSDAVERACPVMKLEIGLNLEETTTCCKLTALQ